MHLHSRDRRKWFAVNFGCNHFRSAPLINPLIVVGLAVPALVLALVAACALVQAYPDSTYLLAVSPALIAARDRGERSVADAQKIIAEMKDKTGAWPADVQARYDKHISDFAEAKKEMNRVEALELQEKELREASEFFTKPVHTLKSQGAAPETPTVTGKEAFGHYLRHAKYDPKAEVIQCRGLSQEALARCVEIHHEAFIAFVKGDVSGLMAYAQSQSDIGPREVHALLENNQTLGGFLVPEDWRNEVIKREAGFAVLAPLCRTEPTNSNVLIFPKVKPHATDVRRSSGFAGDWKSEGYVTGGTAPTVQNQPTFQREQIPVHDWNPDAVEVSPNLLEDSGANVEGIIAEVIAETLAFDKDDVILDGSGVNRPEGVLQAGIATVNSGGATSIAIGGILGMYSELPAQFRRNATWVMASRTMGAILQLNTGTGGVYLFPPNQWNDTILNRPVVFIDFGMDTATAAGGTTFTAADNPLIFGDWKRYIIAQRAGLRIQRLVERYAPNIGILPSARLGGQVVLTDAFRVMTIAA